LDCLAHALFVVEENDEIIGWCRIFPENCYTSSSIGELGIGLLPDYRNQNRGHKMLETAFSWALKQGVKQINLTVNEKNEIAIHIFNNFGFKVFAKEDDIYFMSSKI
jgi:GNAT superfamily N-acetyltransferase